MQEKERLDKLLVEKGLVESREKARALILAGRVSVDGVIISKAGTNVSPLSAIRIQEALPFVSRGGEKLEGFFNEFPVELKDKIAMDIGASTGGFTDCLLKRGIKKVYAVDVGYGQLDYRLRSDERVVNREKVNIRYLDPQTIGEKIDLVTIDVSFISLELVLPVLNNIVSPDSEVVALVKPQFEVGKGEVEKKGIIRDREKHKKVLRKIAAFSQLLGWKVRGMTKSSLPGAKGNIEYFIYLTRSQGSSGISDIETVIGDLIKDAGAEA